MTKEELAEQFAEQKAEELTAIVKEAYLKGYEQGCLNATQTFSIDGFTVVDLGLPSGTMWTKEPLCILHYGYKQERLSYQEAAKLPIPTEEQWNELVEHCRWQGNYSSTGMTFYGVTCIGPNVNSIKFRSKGYIKDEQQVGNINYGGGKVYFWIHDDEEENDTHEKKVISIDKGLEREPSIKNITC